MENNHTAYIGIGSNLNEPIQQVELGLIELQNLAHSSLLQRSSLYRSSPLGPSNQPDYINAVAVLNTDLSAIDLLDKLQAIENKQGRLRTGERWGPRTLDLDILLYDNEQIDTERLSIPHSGIYDRAFVLFPLYECAPDLVLPNGQRIYDLLKRFTSTKS
jgi:2-amino-4-hydroxy-6-hydroxymethyldihydropteridine diphosphokinase